MNKPNLAAIVCHADDFGISPAQSRRILACSSACKGVGALNSVSVLVNSTAFPECAELLRAEGAGLHVGLHVNVVEGPCCADPASVRLLVDEQGIFCLGFAGLLLKSLLRPADMRDQLGVEVGAQLDAFLEAFPEMKDALRVDSHQHFHMIPAVFDALLQAIESRGCTLEHLRVPAEPVLPFLAAPASLLKIPPVNWVKHGVLNFLWRFNRGKVPNWRDISAVFCGINFSGRMLAENVALVLGAFERYAEKRGMKLELLFHPGGVDEESECLNPALDGFVAFYRSPNRAGEARALQSL